MTLLQWNIRGLQAQRPALRYLISRHTPLLLALQETFLRSPPFPIPGYTFLGSPPSPTALFIHNSVPFVPLSLPSPIPHSSAKIYLHRWLTVCSLYLSPSIPLDFQALNSLLRDLPPPILLLGDFNCRHSLWGDTVISTRGRLFETFLHTSNLFLLNTGTPTHFDPRTHSLSCIDLSLCSPALSLDFQWTVLEDSLFSDHFPIKLSLTSTSPIPRPPKWTFRAADWQLFKFLASPSLPLNSFSSPQNLLSYLATLVLNAALTAIPRCTRPPSAKSVPWWTPDCQRALRLKRAAWKRFRRRRSTPDETRCLIEFRRASAVFRRTTRDARSQSWKSYVSHITCDTSPAAVWSRIRRISGKHVPPPSPVLSLGGLSVADTSQVADALGQHFSNISTGSHLSPAFRRIKSVSETVPISFSLSSIGAINAVFSPRELSSALQSCGNTSEGLDGIHYLMLKHLPPCALSYLLSLYNQIWTTGFFPPEWRQAIILPFLKAGKSGHQPQDYRPIALTSCLCKLLERMVNHRLMWHLESRSLISPLQFGYRKNRSTLDPLLRLEQFIRTSFSRRQSVIAVFFDLEKAYDTTWKYHILRVLRSFNFDGNIAVFLKNFLSSRSFQVRIRSHLSRSFLQHEGVPQGSVLSTTLFLLAINGIISSLPPQVSASLYVDDFVLYSADSDIPLLQSRIQSAITAAANWTTTNGFRFSQTKSCAVCFSRSRTIPHPPLFLHGTPLTYRDSTNFLGLVFDCRLNWNTHITSLKTSTLPRLRLLQTLSHLSWGADRVSLLRLHSVLILSKLDYGCQVYSSASTRIISKLDPVHTTGLRLALGAFRSTPVVSLYAEASFPPLNLRRSLLTVKSHARLLQTPAHPLQHPPAHLRHSFQSRPSLLLPFSLRVPALLRSISFTFPPIIPLRIISFPPWLLPTPVVCPPYLPCSRSSLPAPLLHSLHSDHMSQHATATHLYTDGSKVPTGVGFAVFSTFSSLQGTLPPMASILTAELYAILFALQSSFRHPSSSFVIFSDSLSAITSLQTLSPSHPICTLIQEWLFRLSARNKSVQFCWVPGHVGVPGNERADSLARSAASGPAHSPHPVPAADCFPFLMSLHRDLWQSSWNLQIDNKLHTVKPTVLPWPLSTHRNRRWETALARLRLGHTGITHGHLMCRDPPPVCPGCCSPLTITHLFLDCPDTLNHRRAAFPFMSTLRRPPVLTDFLGDSPTFSISCIMSFLNSLRLLPLI